MLLASTNSSSNTPIFIIPNGTIVVEVVLFIIILGIVAKFILPPIQKVMDERDATIKGALDASQEGLLEARRIDEERRATLERARATARASLEAAASQAESLRADARARAQAEHDRLVTEAEATLRAEGQRVRAELASRLEAVVIAGAERVVGVQVDPGSHRQVIDQAIGELGASRQTSESAL